MIIYRVYVTWYVDRVLSGISDFSAVRSNAAGFYGFTLKQTKKTYRIYIVNA